MVAQLDAHYLKLSVWKSISRLVTYSLFEGRPLLTKGRWINPLVFQLLAVAKYLPKLKVVEKPIFMVGIGRSGTTFLGVALSLHPDIAFLNEPKALWHSLIPFEDIIGSYSLTDSRYVLTAADATDNIKQSAHRLYGFLLRTLGAKRVLDKYPEACFRISFLQAIFPDAKFLCILRDGQSTCTSIASWSQRMRTTTRQGICDWWGLNRRKWYYLVDQIVTVDPWLSKNRSVMRTWVRDVDMAAVEWILSVKQIYDLKQSQPKVVHILDYSELCKNPQGCFEELLRFCELEPDPKLLAYIQTTLSPSNSTSPLDLNPLIQQAFYQTNNLFEQLRYLAGNQTSCRQCNQI